MKTMKNHYLILVLFCILSFKTNAQDATTENPKWHYLAEAYLLFPNMEGTTGLGNLPDLPIDADSGDIFNNLKMGAMFYFEAHNDKWAINTDFLYMNLNKEVQKDGKLINSGEVDMKQLGWELSGLYRINPWFEAGAGTRYIGLQMDADINVNTLMGTEDKSKEIKESWIDPIIITRIKYPTQSKWIAELRSDIGGFGVGSDVTWQVQANVGYRFSKLFQTTVGYRWLDIDYESGTGEDRFLYDMMIFGSFVRLGFNF